MDQVRRRLLRSGVAAGSLFLPLPYAWVWAQSEGTNEGTVKLLKAPKMALVVGNGKYKDAPELKNAPNDARAMAESLKAVGFTVTALLDTSKDSLLGAIRDYVRAMEARKAVGLFYFAGHGVQLDWRNYMLPVDAVVDRVEDVAKQSVDVARLMEGLSKAANPMNVIILDACREDPFGKARKPAQKGLSQMDAPTNTILAYATSPGNVASDGDGANGLYTENLLREIKVPEAKIEDVFKRVRLAVRRKTNGAQIPWESTSLEEDFWFLPPKELKRISDAEQERLFAEELALWEKIKDDKSAAPFEAYLRRYPSGNFAELAQLGLERALSASGEKKVRMGGAAGNPFTKGSAMADMNPKLGDTYTYRASDMRTGVERETYTSTVTKVTDNEVYYSAGLITDRLGNSLQSRHGVRYTPNQFLPLEFAVGKRWSTRYVMTRKDGAKSDVEMEARIVTRRQISVPAGTFNAFQLQWRSARLDASQRRTVTNAWFDPERARRPVLREEVATSGDGMKEFYNERVELLNYKQS